NGSAKTASMWDASSFSDFVDTGSTVTYDGSSSGSGASERWQANAAGTSPSFTVAATSSTFSQSYYDQLKLTVSSGHDTPGSTGTAFGSSVASGGTTPFYDRGSTANATLQDATAKESGISYAFTGWSGDASGTGLTSANIVMNGAKVATANWQQDSTGPLTSSETVSPTPTRTAPTVTASVSDTTTGNSNIAAAEYFIDGVGSNGSGTSMSASDGAFNSPTEAVTTALTATAFNALGQGMHTMYVHGEDVAGNWGATTSATFFKDTVAPSSAATSAPYDNSGSIAINAHASDASPSSGVSSVDLYVKKPGDSSFSLQTSNASGVFNFAVPTSTGTPINGTYSFYTIVHDNAGNVEASKSSADTQTLEDTV